MMVSILRSGRRDFKAPNPQRKASIATTPLLSPPPPIPPPPDIQVPSRLRTLSHRATLPTGKALEEEEKAEKLKVQKDLNQGKGPSNEPSHVLPQEPVARSLPSFTDFEVPTLTNTRLRGLSRRDSPPPPPARINRRPKPKKPHPVQQDLTAGQQRPLSPEQLPPGCISTSSLLSGSCSSNEPEKREAGASRARIMPVAVRRSSTSHKTRSNSNEKAISRPVSSGLNGNMANGLVNGHSAAQINEVPHAYNASLPNGLPESTHTHPSQSHHPPPAAAPLRSEEKDREKALERNIDMVVFGDVMFKAWYPSWYPREIIGEKALDGKGLGIVVPTLYVCKRCFGYGKEVHEWVRHCQGCRREVAGSRIYEHGKARGGAIWSVWEVDGDIDTIFCQNLSLFAKLFLDNKSVFFDVSGFNYFLLVHNPSSQIVGFFSKEKMSWDNNNLACILIFPPWQRKGLGSILMGVSYEISRREEILGGPEKPISELGRKGYKMFWGREIARWLLEHRETDRKKGKGMVSVKDISLGTWIHGEDCLGVLREMGVVERAGKGRGEVERVLFDKGRVRDWVEKMGLSLERVVDREGFVEGYGLKQAVEEEEGD